MTSNISKIVALTVDPKTNHCWVFASLIAVCVCYQCTGSVAFSPNTISWYLPRHIDPLISSSQFKLLEVHMGINGQRLDAAEMAARQYAMTVNDIHIIVEIPVGAVGGYFKVSGT